MTSEQIVMEVRAQAQRDGRANPVVHPVMRSVGVLELLSLDPSVSIAPTYRAGHYTVTLPLSDPTFDLADAPTQAYEANRDWWDVLDLVLSPPVDNPAKGAFPR